LYADLHCTKCLSRFSSKSPDGRPIPRHSGSGANKAIRSAFVGKLRGNDHGGPETHNFASAQFVPSALAFRAPDLASKHIRDLQHSRLRNDIRRVADLVGDFCAVLGAMRREAMLGPVLTHWDEAAAYAVIGCLVSAVF
jgi:hypothetical protein